MAEILYNKSFDLAPYQLFVLPSICTQLEKAGLSYQIIMWWTMTGTTCELCTFFWDQDEYYQSSQQVIDSATKPTKVPAYSLMDIERTLPRGYLLEKKADGYQLMMDDIWKVEPVNSERMADCFALMLLQCLIKRVLKVEDVNESLKKSLPVKSI